MIFVTHITPLVPLRSCRCRPIESSLSGADMSRAKDKLKSAFGPLTELQQAIAEEHNRLVFSRQNIAPSTLPQVSEDVRLQDSHHPARAPGRESMSGMFSPWEMESVGRPRCRNKPAADGRGGIAGPRGGETVEGYAGWQGESRATVAAGRAVASERVHAFQQGYSTELPQGSQSAAAGECSATAASPHRGLGRPLQIQVLECVMDSYGEGGAESCCRAFRTCDETKVFYQESGFGCGIHFE